MAIDPEITLVWPEEIGPDGTIYPAERYSPPPIGLDPHRFDVDELEAIPVEKMELWDGVIYGPTEKERDAMLLALLSNAGLRHVIGLVPRERWLAALAGW